MKKILSLTLSQGEEMRVNFSFFDNLGFLFSYLGSRGADLGLGEVSNQQVVQQGVIR